VLVCLVWPSLPRLFMGSPDRDYFDIGSRCSISIANMQPSPLANPLATVAQLEESGSRLDGVPADLENSIRFAGARLTQAAGILLRLPQEVIAQAVVVFMRFWIGSEGGSLVELGAKVRFPNSIIEYTANIGRSKSPQPPFT
jgi:hypothetical protein